MDASIRSRSIIISVAIHLFIFLILLFTVMTTQIPPFPEPGGGGGVLVDIGTVDMATGNIQPMSEVTTEDPVYETVKSKPAPEEEVATQETEDAAVVAKPIKEKPTTVVKRNPTPAPTNKPVKETPRKADPLAIYGGRSNNSTSQGTAKSGTGDQGSRTGDPNALFPGRGGAGGTGDGTGTGNGSGSGPGSGSGDGKGVSFSLTGRSMVRAPQVSDRSQETGKVVVEITVDNNGTVVSAFPGGRGSTTTSQYLFKLAKEAAMKAKFNPSPNAADIQKGTMTFVFVVQ